VKRTLCLSFVLGSFAWASQADDRAAIEKVIAGLNDSPRSPALFVPGFSGFGELERLDSPLAGEVQSSPNLPTASPETIVFRWQPLGEATWFTIPVHADPVRLTSRFKIQSVRFIAKDVALVEASDGHYIERGSTMNQRGSSPALFVVKKNHKVWRIDSVHTVAQP